MNCRRGSAVVAPRKVTGEKTARYAVETPDTNQRGAFVREAKGAAAVAADAAAAAAVQAVRYTGADFVLGSIRLGAEDSRPS